MTRKIHITETDLRRMINECVNRILLAESHYDEYYHFTEDFGLKGILETDIFKFDETRAGFESGFRGSEGGYMSLTRMPNIEQGYQGHLLKFAEKEYGEAKIARITFDGVKLNNIRNVQIRPLDYVYNWNKQADDVNAGKTERKTGWEGFTRIHTGEYQNASPMDAFNAATSRDEDAVMKAVTSRPGDGLTSGRGAYTGGRETETPKYARIKKDAEAKRKESQKRQMMAQAEESLILTNGGTEIPNISRYIVCIDILEPSLSYDAVVAWDKQLDTQNPNIKANRLNPKHPASFFQILYRKACDWGIIQAYEKDKSWGEKIFIFSNKGDFNLRRRNKATSLEQFMQTLTELGKQREKQAVSLSENKKKRRS